MSNNRITTSTIRARKEAGEAISMLTAYDAAFARLFDEAGIDMLLVCDSVGNTMLGYDSTLPVTMEDMLHHVKAVSRGASRAMIVADMPFMSYQTSIADALYNAGRFLKETGAQAVKLEGGAAVAPAIQAMTAAGSGTFGA